MYLHNLTLINFKNYQDAAVIFSPKINCFRGNNGEGKTNLLDAIHYLSLCKSHSNLIDSQNIYHNAPFFVIQGGVKNENSTDKLHCGVKRQGKKIFKKNDKSYQRLADHVGSYPLVIVSPEDTQLVIEGSELRRKFIDSSIAQFDSPYLNNLIEYNKALTNRNILLRNFAGKKEVDELSFEIWDKQLADFSIKIFEKRKKFIGEIVPIFQSFYKHLTGEKEIVSLKYFSQLEGNDVYQLLSDSFNKDRFLERTTVGIHKDDIILEIDQYPAKRYGSQGQQKSFVVALKLAQYEYIRSKKGINPFFLLDDIFDRLDDNRVNKLMEIISGDSFGQLFITDTHTDRLKNIFKKLPVSSLFFKVSDGKIESDN